MDAKQLEKEFKAWIATKKILVLDSNSSSRNGFIKLLSGAGAKSSNIFSAPDYPSAKDYLAKALPDMIVSEYEFKGGNGLVFSQEMAALYGNKEKIFVLLTGNSSQSLVAQAAEEDIDVFILKPYTIKQVNEILSSTVMEKVNPSDYVKMINHGKQLMNDGKIDESIDIFTKAATLTKQPALAHFYRGQAEICKSLTSSAQASFEEGLKSNEIHYKCMTGLFDLLIAQNKFSEAYMVVKKMASTFPSNPKRLAQIVMLSIQTNHLSDLDEYYELFKNIEARTEELVKYICAALVVAGRFFLRNDQTQKGIDFLTKASISTSGNVNILAEIIFSYCDRKMMDEARAVFKRIPQAKLESPIGITAQFAIFNADEKDPVQVLSRIQQIEKDNIKEPYIVYWKLKRMKETGRIKQMEEALAEAETLWPNRINYFKSATLA